MNRATVILTHYKRPDNVEPILRALREQHENSDLFVWDNSPVDRPWPETARVVRAPWNAGCCARILYAFFVETPWVIFMDDDLIPGDPGVIGHAVDLAELRPGGITGINGVDVRFEHPYYRNDASGRVAAVKGRFMVFRKELLDRVRVARFPIHLDPRYRNRVDDLYLSFEIGRMLPAHWVDTALWARFSNLPEGPDALCAQPDHDQIRNEFIRDYFSMISK